MRKQYPVADDIIKLNSIVAKCQPYQQLNAPKKIQALEAKLKPIYEDMKLKKIHVQSTQATDSEKLEFQNICEEIAKIEDECEALRKADEALRPRKYAKL